MQVVGITRPAADAVAAAHAVKHIVLRIALPPVIPADGCGRLNLACRADRWPEPALVQYLATGIQVDRQLIGQHEPACAAIRVGNDAIADGFRIQGRSGLFTPPRGQDITLVLGRALKIERYGIQRGAVFAALGLDRAFHAPWPIAAFAPRIGYAKGPGHANRVIGMTGRPLANCPVTGGILDQQRIIMGDVVSAARRADPSDQPCFVRQSVDRERDRNRDVEVLQHQT